MPLLSPSFSQGTSVCARMCLVLRVLIEWAVVVPTGLLAGAQLCFALLTRRGYCYSLACLLGVCLGV